MQVARAFLRVLLGAPRSRPLLAIVEDLHLVDPESLGVLRLLAPEEAEPALSIVGTGRPEALDDARDLGGAVLELPPLAPSDMRALAQRICPAGTPDEVLERVVARADGVAFVLEELARSVAASAAGVDLPPSVESAIHARLGQLSRPAKEVAEALSLLGEQVELDLLRDVAGVEAHRLARLLSELERFAFVRTHGRRRTGFRHHILAEACANTIPRQRRAALHRAALAALEARPRDLPGRRLRLATHAEGAGDDARALSYLWEAAAQARGTSAAASLNLIFDRAVALIDRLGAAAAKTYVDFVLMAFPSMLLLGEFAKMRTHLPKVMALARAQQRPDKVSNSLSQLGMLCWFEGRYEEGRAATEEGRRIARELDLPALVYSNQLMLANVLHGMGRLDEALAELAGLQALLGGELAATRWGAPAIPLSTTLSFVGWIKADTEDLEGALDHARRGLEIARGQRDPYAEIMARNALGRAFLQMGRHEEAVRCLQVAWDLAETHGYDATKANLAGHMASALARLGRAEEGAALAEGCLARRLHLRTGRMENVLLLAGYAEAVARGGDVARGLALLDEALAIASAIDNPALLANGLELRARLRAGRDPNDPRAAADRAAAAGQRRRIVGAKATLADLA
ncbi:tetratricopeptide repeat protein [Phenylobacterium sp.]|uniref:tetratricopeptide repeat protein n=1 Tax=Phenylobacterium sp. TaxID=1871053 RepID=UPI0035AF95A2